MGGRGLQPTPLLTARSRNSRSLSVRGRGGDDGAAAVSEEEAAVAVAAVEASPR